MNWLEILFWCAALTLCLPPAVFLWWLFFVCVRPLPHPVIERLEARENRERRELAAFVDRIEADESWCEHCPASGTCCVCSSVHKVRQLSDTDAAVMERVLSDSGSWDAGEWWNSHRNDVSAAVARVGVDLRRGRYR